MLRATEGDAKGSGHGGGKITANGRTEPGTGSNRIILFIAARITRSSANAGESYHSHNSDHHALVVRPAGEGRVKQYRDR